MNGEEIAKEFIKDNSAIFPSDAIFMAKEMENMPQNGSLLEIGTGYGHSSVFFSNLKPDWTIYTIDGFGQYGSVPQYFNPGGRFSFSVEGYLATKAYIDSKSLGNVIQIVGDSNHLKWNLPVDVLFLDGDHTYQGLKNDFNIYSPYAKTIFFHDYNLSRMEGNGVMEFIETIKDEWEITDGGYVAKGVRK